MYSNIFCVCVCVCRDEDYRSEPDGSNGSFIGYKPHIEELEMLLEAYFVQIDGTLNKLSHVIYLHCPFYFRRY
jgi:hypothetical protein